MSERVPTPGAARDVGSGRAVIWRFSDGKAGHDNQSLGLAEALAEAVACELYTLAPLGAAAALGGLLTGRAFADPALPDPDLVLGAGHATHLSMLAARRARAGRVVVLMAPTLPRRCFDLCLIPEHDRPLEADNVVVTRGALNRVRPGDRRDQASGLILVGGPSAHFAFDPQAVLAQIRTVVGADPHMRWSVATSRRTPVGFSDALRALEAPNLVVVPVEEAAPGWLSASLGRAARAWVSEDSASMVYEALSSGAAVGLLTLEAARGGRLARGLKQLARDGLVTRFEDWTSGKSLARPEAPLDESGRCARLILDRWPEIRRRAGR